jgi:aromatic ring-opening dioxygenase LigB subunit
MRFRYKYLTNLRYKNFYITKKFHEIDTSRNELDMDTILPLTYKERKYLVEMTSIRTIWQEWHHMFSASITLTYSTFHLIGIMIADYSLFWLLSMIKFYGNQTDDGIENEGEKSRF